jgi:hypothetical protein
MSTAKTVGAGKGEAIVKGQTDVRNANTSISILNSIDKLLGQGPTASVVGALTDKALGGVGVSTKGGDVASALKVEANRLLMNVPRFEGPQSDKDVQSYKEAAGDLGNEMLPIGKRKAAAAQIREIMNRNIKNNTIQFGETPPPVQPTQPTQGGRIRFDAQGNIIP